MSNSQVLNQKSIEILRGLASTSPEKLKFSLDDIDTAEKLVYVDWMSAIPAPITLNCDEALEKPALDALNSALIFNNYSALTPALASDERLWVTLCFRDYSNYASFRHNLNPKTDLAIHWFAATSRDRWRDNAISRLWWSGWMASNISTLTQSEALDTLYCNSDMITSFMGRPGISSDLDLAGDILKFVHERYVQANDGRYVKDQFRKFLMEVDLKAGKVHIGALNTEDRNKLISECWDKRVA